MVRRGSVVALGVSLFASGVLAAPPAGAARADGEPSWGAGPLAVEFHAANVLVRTVDGADEIAINALFKSAGVQEVFYRSRLVPGLLAVRGPEGGVAELIKVLSASPLVRYAEPDVIYHAMRLRGGGMAQSTPYGINLVNAPAAWAMGARGAGVRVADLDTGLDLGHPDLPVPVAQQSFVAGQPVQDGNDHGTHTAGTILAIDNDIGVVGVAPDADLVVGKVLGDSGSGATSGIIAGIDWAVTQNAKVVSMSLGGGGFNQAFADSCLAARNAGVVVVASSGNAGNSTPNYPASYPGVISVGAVDSAAAIASFSSFGVNVDLAAPGVAVNSTVPRTLAAIWLGAARNTVILIGSPSVELPAAEVINCGNGGTPGDFPPEVAGKIAHIRRGGQVPPSTSNITFNTKANNALEAGAVGVIISDDGRGLGSWTLNISGTFAIPVVGVSQADGNTLDAAPAGTTASIGYVGGGYASFNGTSMACPHVSGVAALLIGAFPADLATPDLVEQAMKVTATDLGAPGRDDFYGDGLVNASAALAWLQGQITVCPADIALAGSGLPGKDGLLTGADFDLFIAAFFGEMRDAQNNLIADLATAGTGALVPDELLTGDDFDAFIGLFFGGCD